MMFDGIKKRLTAGVLAAAALFSSLPAASADATTDVPDEQVTDVRFEVGDNVYGLHDGDQLNKHGICGLQGPLYEATAKAKEDGARVHAYCLNKGWSSPHSTYRISKQFDGTHGDSDYIMAAFASISDARNTRDYFVDKIREFVGESEKNVLTKDNFTEDDYYVASQIAAWVTVDDAFIQKGSGEGFSWNTSTSIKDSTGAQLFDESTTLWVYAGSGTDQAGRRILFAAMKMLEYAAKKADEWKVLGHVPHMGSAFIYSPGTGSFDPAKKQTGHLALPDSVAASGKFVEKTYEVPGAGQKEFWVLPMAVGSATEVVGTTGDKTISGMALHAYNLPEGAYLRTVGKANDGSDYVYWSAPKTQNGETYHEVGLNNISYHKGDQVYYANRNGEDYGQTFELCISKSSGNAALDITITADINAHCYEAFYAYPLDQMTQI